MDVPPKAGTMIVNLGDKLERWTNLHYKSTKHRVSRADLIPVHQPTTHAAPLTPNRFSGTFSEIALEAITNRTCAQAAARTWRTLQLTR